MQRKYDHNVSSSRIVTRHNNQPPMITINSTSNNLSPYIDHSSHRQFPNRSFSNNTSFIRTNGDESRIDKSAQFREYGDYNKSNITHITTNGNTSVASEMKKGRKLDYELKYRDENIKKLEIENKELLRELHRLRKIEAGWSLGGYKQNIEETKIHNTYIVEQNNNLKIEIEEYKAKYLELEEIVESLEEEKRELERMLQEQRSDSTQETLLRKEIERFKSKESIEIKKISEEQIKIDNERKQLHQEREKQNEEIERYRRDRDRYRDQRDNVRQKLKSLEIALEQHKETILEMEREHERHREVRIEDNPRYQELENESRRKENELRKLQTEIEILRRIRIEKTNIESELTELNTHIGQLSQENQFLHKKLAIIENGPKADRRIEYSDSERVQELERLLEMYKSRITARDDQIITLRKEVDIYKDEVQRYKFTKDEIEIKSRLGSTLEHKNELQKLKVMRIRTEELESRVKHLELENKRLRDVLQQSGIRSDNNLYIDKNPYKNGHFNNEIEDMGVKAMLKELEMERFKKQNKDEYTEVNRTLHESINDSWEAIH